MAITEGNELSVQDVREQYLASVASLAKSKTQAEVVAYLERYLAADENRAKLLKDMVRPTLQAINNFELEAYQLGIQITEINTAITAVGSQILVDQFRAFQSPGPEIEGNPMEILRQRTSNLKRISGETARSSIRMTDLDWQGVMVRSFAVAQAVVDTRSAALESFAVNSLHLTIEDFEKAGVETAKDRLFVAVEDAADAMITLASDPENLSTLGESAADLVGYSVGPLWAAGKLAFQLVRKAKEVKGTYEGRTQIDELFEFIEIVRQTDDLNRTQLALLRTQAEVYRRQIVSGAKPH